MEQYQCQKNEVTVYVLVRHILCLRKVSAWYSSAWQYLSYSCLLFLLGKCLYIEKYTLYIYYDIYNINVNKIRTHLVMPMYNFLMYNVQLFHLFFLYLSHITQLKWRYQKYKSVCGLIILRWHKPYTIFIFFTIRRNVHEIKRNIVHLCKL